MHDGEELEKHGMKTWGPLLESSGNFSALALARLESKKYFGLLLQQAL